MYWGYFAEGKVKDRWLGIRTYSPGLTGHDRLDKGVGGLQFQEHCFLCVR